MVIIGAKGFAKEVLEDIHKKYDDVKLYDNINIKEPNTLFGKYFIIRDEEELSNHFNNHNPTYTLGVGSPLVRHKLSKIVNNLGGELTSTISDNASIGSFDNIIGYGCNIMSGAILTNSIKIGVGSLININSTIGRAVLIGDFCELSPGAKISGNCIIGNFCDIGTNASILPKIKIGNNVTVGSGCVVTKDIPDNCVVVGVPGKIIKHKVLNL